MEILSKRRNPILADIFSRLKYMECRGGGFKIISADCEGKMELDQPKMPALDVKAGKVYSADSIEAERKRGLENSET